MPLRDIQRLWALQRSDQVGTSCTADGRPCLARSVFRRLTIEAADRGDGCEAAAALGSATAPARTAVSIRAITPVTLCDGQAACRRLQDLVHRRGESPPAATARQAMSPRSAALTDVARPCATFHVHTAERRTSRPWRWPVM